MQSGKHLTATTFTLRLSEKAGMHESALREKPEQATPVCEDAYNIFIGAGNRLDAADAVRLMADGIGTGGHFELAIATYQRALNLLADMGEHVKTGAILNNMAINYANEGKLDRAERLYEQAKLHFQQAGRKGARRLRWAISQIFIT